MRLSPAGVARLACLDTRYLVLACQGLIARLRKVHESAAAGRGDRQDLQARHEENTEALLNFLAVLDAEGAHPEIRKQLRAGLDHVLTLGSSLQGD